MDSYILSPAVVQDADSPTLKRSFFAPNSPVPSKKLEHSFPSYFNPAGSLPSHRWTSGPSSRCPRLASPRTRRPSMVQTSARTSMPMPSFASVFGGSTQLRNLSDHDSSDGSSVIRPASSGNVHGPFSSFHAHRDSRDSTSTASSDNSPTTTISTMDSSSVTDPSPGVSPESPLAKTAAPSSFVADFRSRRADTGSGDSSPNTFFELQRPTTPAKKPRNLKNLGINTASSFSNLRANAPAPVAVVNKEKNNSAPPSPLFIKPPTPPKRRPSNLSLTISPPGCADSKPAKLIIPSTPAFNRPALRHFQSSPSLPSSLTNQGLAGGFPSLRPIVTKPSGLSEVPFEMEEEEDQEPNFDVPQSREEKPAAYPNGPICIYPAGVYLYFEPTAEQATTFDTIINVASEVKNPFNANASESQKDLDARRVDGPPAESVDFATLNNRSKLSLNARSSSPTTPKAVPIMQVTPAGEIVIDGKTLKMPEYIHMPWEHNTDIVSDLYKLVKIIDERVQEGKRVLIHCQCGVSRSASLIVAYGLYKDPQMSVQDAYDRAKKRSRWIGPNMNLIMQLQEFRNGLLRANDRSSYNQGYGRRSAGLNTTRSNGNSRYSPYDGEARSGSRTPRTAPLPPESDITMQRASTGNMMAISPGPLSAPSGVFQPGFRRSWDSSHTFNLTSEPAPYVDTTGHVVPAPVENEPMEIESSDTLKPLAVPNFSRQLPLRSVENRNGAQRESQLQPLGFDALKSPAVASFNNPSIATQEHPEAEIMSPIKTTFDWNAWPSHSDSQPSAPPARIREVSISAVSAPVPLMSPRASEFRMTGLGKGDIDESFGLLSPRATSFNLSGSGFPCPNDIPEEPSIASPIATHFPNDIFGQDDAMEEDLTSPRSTEFHMAPLKPATGDEDPFGLTSPTRFEYGNPFERPSLTVTNPETDERSRPFQAILPPSHQTFTGFASLNGTAQSHPIPTQLSKPAIDLRIDSLSTSPENPTPASEIGLPTLPLPPPTPQTPKAIFLATPQKSIRTRFSSPNLREQRKLHKLQTELEARLPNRPAAPQHAADDIDALLSPRAEEFTRNPFHVELTTTAEDVSPASSCETVRDARGSGGADWGVKGNGSVLEDGAMQWTPEKATVDPRSPVQSGSSPIVRSIWDVL